MPNTQLRRHGLLLFSLLALLSGESKADSEHLVLYFHERPPYMYLDTQGQLQGLTSTAARRAFESTQAEVVFRELPAPRQLAVLESNQVKACGLGWFDSDMRREFLRYSLPLYRDQAIIAITHESNTKLQSSERASQLLTQSDITTLVKAGYSYGTYLDALLHDNQQVQAVSASNQVMLNMVASQRVDMMFIAPEELAGLIAETSYQPDNFRAISLHDMERGMPRHIVCSFLVSERTMQEVNNWIKHNLLVQ